MQSDCGSILVPNTGSLEEKVYSAKLADSNDDTNKEEHQPSRLDCQPTTPSSQRSELDTSILRARDDAFSISKKMNVWAQKQCKYANLLHSRYEQFGDFEDLKTSIRITEDVLRTRPTHCPKRSSRLLKLGFALLCRYEYLGDATDLSNAISKTELSISLTTSDFPQRAGRLQNLAYMFIEQFKRTGDTEHLEAALSTAEQATSLTPAADQSRAHKLHDWAFAYSLKYDRFGDEMYLNKAISLTEESLQGITPKVDDSCARSLHNLGLFLSKRYHHRGQLEDLQTGISKVALALECTPHSHTQRLFRLQALVSLRIQHYHAEKDVHDLDQAVSEAEQALSATPEAHSQRSGNLHNLGCALRYRYDCNQDMNDLKTALIYFLEATRCENSSPLIRIRSTRQAIKILRTQDRWEEASSLAQAAIDLFPGLCSRFLSLSDQQAAVSQTSGLAADACSLSIRIGNAGKALQQIEFGRGMILGNLFDRQSDVSRLKQAQPTLAEEYESARFAAFNPSTTKQPSERQRARETLEDCERRIRGIADFEDFSRPPTLETLKRIAHDGPIIVVNVTEIGSDAIVVTRSSIRTVPLPLMDLNHPDNAKWIAEKHVTSTYPESERIFAKPNSRKPDRYISPQVLSWLWHACVKPILQTFTELKSPATSQDVPRTWWIGTGAASSIPFHAAAASCDDGFQSCLQYTVPSYTTTLKALSHSRERALRISADHETGQASLALITMTSTPGQGALPGVSREALVIQDAVNTKYQIVRLEQPTANQVLQSIQECDIAHFACHGSADPTSPSESHLLLQREEGDDLVVDKLTLASLMDASSQTRAWIAYLSACSTAEIKTKYFEDEGLHLASAFQVAGFSHVIGSLWTTHDDICVEVARLFYKELSKAEGILDRSRAIASALRTAVRVVQEQNLDKPHLWGPFVHFGA